MIIRTQCRNRMLTCENLLGMNKLEPCEGKGGIPAAFIVVYDYVKPYFDNDIV